MRRIRTTFWPEIPPKGDVRREILIRIDKRAVGNGGIRVAQIWAGISPKIPSRIRQLISVPSPDLDLQIDSAIHLYVSHGVRYRLAQKLLFAQTVEVPDWRSGG